MATGALAINKLGMGIYILSSSVRVMALNKGNLIPTLFNMFLTCGNPAYSMNIYEFQTCSICVLWVNARDAITYAYAYGTGDPLNVCRYLNNLKCYLIKKVFILQWNWI